MEKSTHGEEPREEAEHAEAAAAGAYRANTRILDPALFSDIAPARGEARTQAAATEERAVPFERSPLRAPSAKQPSPPSALAPGIHRRPIRRAHLLLVAGGALALVSFAVLKLQRAELPPPPPGSAAPDPTSTPGEPVPEAFSAAPSGDSVPPSATVAAGSTARASAETPAVQLAAPTPKSAPAGATSTSAASPTSRAPASAPAGTRPAAAGSMVFPND